MQLFKSKSRYAKNQRKRATAGEKRMRWGLWLLGYKWQAYDPTGYLPDFVSGLWCVAVEVDGGIHNHPKVKGFDKLKAKRRMKQAGYITIRISEAAGKERPILSLIYIGTVGILWRLGRFLFYK